MLVRVKTFAWRAALDDLPTNVGPHQRMVQVVASCRLCGCPAKTGLRALYGCAFAQSIWEASAMEVTMPSGCTLVADWWGSCFKTMDAVERAKILTFCWAIWGARCKSIEGEVWSSKSVVDYANSTFNQVMGLGEEKQMRGVQGDSNLNAKWRPPVEGGFKINVDASIFGGSRSGLGVVCRNELGEVVGRGAIQSTTRWEPMVAEAKAMVECLMLAREVGVDRVECEGDCLAMIQAMSSKKTGQNKFFLAIDDIRMLTSSFSSVHWSFVRRSGNNVAHALAHFQPLELGKRVWIEDVPDSIVSLALADLI